MVFYVARYKGVEKKEFEVEVITPLFLGGADPRRAELRVPPIKGALRFWWRALYGSEDIRKMKEDESAIFGSTDSKSSIDFRVEKISGTAPVLEDLPKGRLVPVEGKRFRMSIIDYLAFGLHEYNKNKKKVVYIKQHIPPGARFKLTMMIKSHSYMEQILESLGMLAHYGGLGARARNGFGSVHIPNLRDPLRLKNGLKPFTAMSDMAIVFNGFPERDTWEDALSDIGDAYRTARTSLERRHVFEKRQLIAKPIIVKREVNINERHSKPYFLHVSKVAGNRYKGRILFAPYKYYVNSKRREYLEACEKMNQFLRKATGGAK